MSKRSVIVFACVLTVSVGMPAAAGAQMAKKTDPAISAISSAYAKATNAEDVAGLIKLYTDDAVEMPPNMPALKGKAAIEAYYKQQFADADAKGTITPIESAITGNSAYEVGTFTQSIKMKTGESMDDVGKYVVILKQGADKQWKVAYVVYNSDKPPMPPPPAAKK